MVMQYFKRRLHQDIKKHVQEKQITVITGMRRVGKTTLVKAVLDEIDGENKLYIDLERIDYRELFREKNYENILISLSDLGIDLRRKAVVGIDEIQYAPHAISAIKYLYDHHNIKFVLTGSSSYYLKNLFSESLSGRKKIFELYPLDFGEFLLFKGAEEKAVGFPGETVNKNRYERLKAFYEEYLAFGGFPEAVLSRSRKQKKDLLNDILSSYVNIDIQTLSDFKSRIDIYNLLKILAARVASKVDYVKTGEISGISRHTARNYLELFEKTYLIELLPVFTKSPDREIVKAKKLYFCDNGILNVLAEIDSGRQFENAVFNQLNRGNSIKYYSRKNGREIDFILNSRYALEVKETPTAGDLKDLGPLAKMAKLKEAYLVGRRLSPRFDKFIWGGDIR